MKLSYVPLLLAVAIATNACAAEAVRTTKECTGSNELVLPASERPIAPDIRLDYVNIVHHDDPCGQSLSLEGISELKRAINEAVASTMIGTRSQLKFIVQYTITQSNSVEFDFGVDGNTSADEDRLGSLYLATYQLSPQINGKGKIVVSFEYSTSPSD